MNRLPVVVLVLVLLLLEACSGSPRYSAPAAPSPVQVAPPAPYVPAITVSQHIALGHELADTFIGNPLIYDVSASSDGTLVVALEWDPGRGTDDVAHLKLIMGECAVPHGRGYPICATAVDVPGPGPAWSSPVIGRVIVSAGRTYRVIVDEGLAPWDYGFNQPFTLTASIE